MLDDLKLAWKRLRNAPGFAVAAVLTLALAVGANTAIFTVADAVLFRPLPYENPDQLFVVRSVDRATGFRSPAVPYEYVAAIQRHHTGVAAVALRSTTTMMNHAGADGGESVETFAAAPDYFQILGVRPLRGRLFDASDAPQGSRRVVLTYESWRRRFGGDEAIIGRDVTLGNTERTVVGILPPGFIFPVATSFYSDATTGRAEYATAAVPPDPGDPRKRNSITAARMAINAIVRLKPGVTRQQAQAELDVLLKSIAPPRPQDAERPIVLDDLRSLLFPRGRQVLVLLLVSAGLVLFIGCANLANMLIARTHRRERDLAVHAALGASRLRLMRPVFFETLIIGTAAAIVAVCLTIGTFDALIREVPPVAYGRADIGVDLRVAAFALMLGMVAGLLFAIVPAYRVSRLDVQVLMRKSHYRAGGRRRAGLSGPMVAAQVAIAVLVVVGAATTARQFVEVLERPLGFSPDNVIGVHVYVRLEGATRRDFYQRAVATLRDRGDVVAAGAGSSRPFDRFSGAETLPAGTQQLPVAHVLPGYLETLDVRVREGRLPTSDDAPMDLEPAVLTESAARILFPGGQAVGETIELKGRKSQVVGVIDDVVTGLDDAERRLWVYVVPRDPARVSTIVVRTRATNAEVFDGIRREVVKLVPPSEPVRGRWLAESIGMNSGYRDPRFRAVVLGTFGLLALALAALGIFATVAAAVAARTREMGVRLAIGAQPRALVRLVLRDALAPVAVGIVAGVFATRAAGRIAGAAAAGLDSPDLNALGMAIAAMLAAAVLAAYLPARRAARVDPIVILRAE